MKLKYILTIILLCFIVLTCERNKSTRENNVASDFFKNKAVHTGVETFITNDIIQLHKAVSKGKVKKIKKLLNDMSVDGIIDWTTITLVVGKIEDVENLLTLALESKPDGSLHFHQGICRLILNNNENAGESFKQALSATPAFKKAWPGLILAYIKREKIDMAITTAQKALLECEDDQAVFGSVTLLYLYAQQKKGSIQLIDEKKLDIPLLLDTQQNRNTQLNIRFDRFSNPADLGVTIARNYFLNIDYQKAEIVLRRCLKLDPQHITAINDLGSLLSHQPEKMKDAIVLYEEKIETYPDLNILRYNLGMLYAKEERYDKAIEQYEKCLLLDEQWIEPRVELVKSCIVSGEKEKAAIHIEKLSDQKKNPVIGCTEDEIKAFETYISPKYNLPQAYKEFLHYGGKEMGRLFYSTDFSYNATKILLESNNKDILKMLRIEDNNAELTEDMFVLCENLGSNFIYFKLNEGDNPPVYFWEEGEGGLEVAEIANNTFTDFLHARLEIYKQYGDWPVIVI